MTPAARPIAVAVLLIASAGCALDPPAPDPARVDPERLSGTWYVIAAGSQFAETQSVGCTVELGLDPSGPLHVARRCHSRAFEAPESVTELDLQALDRARWKTADVWPFTREWRVLYAGPEYRVALVGGATAAQAQVLARENQIEPWIYAGLLARLGELGYDVAALRRIPQQPADVGRRGVLR